MWEKLGKAKPPVELLAQVAECALLETSGKNLALQDTGPDCAQRAVAGNSVRRQRRWSQFRSFQDARESSQIIPGRS